MRLARVSVAALAGRLVFAGALVVAASIWLPSILDLIDRGEAETGVSKPGALVLSGTTALETRPLFHPSRRSTRPDRPAAAAASTGAFEERYVLRGYVSGDGDPVGIFEQVGTGHSARMRVGQMLDGHRLVAIEPGLAQFQTEGGAPASLKRRAMP